MKRVNIFLASSSQLEQDRRSFEIFLSRKNNILSKNGIFLELNIWEDFIDALSKTRLQDEYNKTIKNADFFLMLFFTKVGKYTFEEFKVAVKNFKLEGKPYIYTYFKDENILTSQINQNDFLNLFEFKKLLNELGHFVTEYRNLDHLHNHFYSQLEKLGVINTVNNSLFEDNINIIKPINIKNSVNKGFISFIDTVSPMLEFDNEIVTNYRSKLKVRVLEIIPSNFSNREFLISADVLQSDHLTFAGALLFSKNPTKILKTASAQCYFYLGTTKTAKRESHIFEDPVQIQIELAYNFLLNRMEKNEYPESGSVLAKTDYLFPLICLREMIANALVHRDYSDFKRNTHIRLFTNRIEISSPGNWQGKHLVPGVKTKISSLESQSIKRNYSLSKLISWISIVELEGSGIPKSLEDCKINNAKEPEVIFEDNFVTVIIYPKSDWRTYEKENAEKEYKIWEKTIKSDTLEMFNNYISSYPQGRFSNEALGKIKIITRELETRKIKILELLKNRPKSIWSLELKHYLKEGIINSSDLHNINLFSEKQIELLLNDNVYTSYTQLPSDSSDFNINIDGVDIYFWGMPGSGKTCLISSLLQTGIRENILQINVNDKIGFTYANSLLKLHTNNILPPATFVETVIRINTSLTIKNNKVIGLNFIEESGERYKKSINNLGIDHPKSFTDEYMEGHNSKILFFLLDSNLILNKSESDYDSSQELQIVTIIKYLQFEKKLNLVNSIYIIFTKYDLLTDLQSEPFDFFRDRYPYLYNTLINLQKENRFKLRLLESSIGKFVIGDVFEASYKSSSKILKALQEDLLDNIRYSWRKWILR